MKKNMMYLLVIATTMASFYYFILRRPAYTPHVDVFTFERNIDVDEGQPLVAAKLVSREGVRLTEIFNPSRRAFTPERFSRYGADRSNPMGGGIGLKVKFVTINGERIETKEFILPGWYAFERPTTRPQRRTEVKAAEPRFAQAIEAFAAPISIRRTFGIALDITEGVQPALSKRVRKIIDETHAVKLGADPKNSVILSLYNITESPYQGGRERPDITRPESVRAGLEWLLKERPAQSRSSVLRGLVAVLEEMSRGGNPRLDVFSDGLENTEELSVYKKPELLEEVNWVTLDGIAHLENLKLSGLAVHIHPLPAKSARYAELMEKGLAYLADRLKKAGATVKVEPF